MKGLVDSEANFIDEDKTIKENYDALLARHCERMPALQKEQLDIIKNGRKTNQELIRSWHTKFVIEIQKYEEIASSICVLQQCEYFVASLEKDLKWKNFRHEICTDVQIFEKGKMIDNWLTMDHLYTLALAEERKLLDTPDGIQEIAQATDEKSAVWEFRKKCDNCGGVGHFKNICSSAERPSNNKLVKASVALNGNNGSGKDKPSRQRKEHKSQPESKQTDDQNYEGWMTDNTLARNDIFMDSCCTKVFVNNLSYFKTYTAFKEPKYFGTASDMPGKVADSRMIAGDGVVIMELKYNGEIHEIELPAVYIPHGRNNLVPEGLFYEWIEGYSVVNTRTGKTISFRGKTIGSIERLPNLLYQFANTKFQSLVQFLQNCYMPGVVMQGMPV